MAKSKQNGTMTKADAIRNYLSSIPRRRPKRSRKPWPNRGSRYPTITFISSRATRKQSSVAKGERLRAVAAARPEIKNPADAVNQVKMLAHQLGGLSSLKALVDALSD